MENFEKIAQLVIDGDDKALKPLVKEMVEAGVNPLDIINQGLIAGMDTVGKLFKEEEMYVPEVLMSGRAMAGAIEVVKPFLSDMNMPSLGKVVLGTIKGDIHDIGKNLVGLMLECAGFTLIDLGVDVSPEKFVQAVKEEKPNIVGISALLTTTMMGMKDTIEELKAQGLRQEVKVIVGGACISQDFADQIGADGYAADSSSAVELCKKLLA